MAVHPSDRNDWLASMSHLDEYLAVCKQAVASQFGGFKRSPAYRRILEHVSESQGQAYFEVVLAENPGLESVFPKFQENDRYGQPLVFDYGEWTFSPTTLRYVKVLSDLINLFGSLDQMSIIEIGGGYGGQCKIISDVFAFRSYTIVDLEPVTRLQESYLSAINVPNVLCWTPNQIPDREYDVVISNYAISELNAESQEFYFEAVLRRCRRGYTTWNRDHHIDFQGLTTAPRFLDERPLTGPSNHVVVWGDRKDNIVL